MKFFKNPNNLPLEELNLSIKSDGVTVAISALNEKWADKRYFLRYEVPEIYKDNGSEIMGYKEYWIEVIDYIIEDLIWLLGLPFYRFWSNIVYNASIMDTLVSFLQEAPPFYALESFPAEPKMLEQLEKLRYNVLMVFARLVTSKESIAEYMTGPFHGTLLYNNYIFTIPIIFDLCQLYGRENEKFIGEILSRIFTLQPMYNDDLEKSVSCLIQALQNVEQKFEDCPVSATEGAVALSSRRNASAKMTLFKLESLILYVLDLSSTLTMLLKCYPVVIGIFHREDFMSKILSVYANTISEMYKELDKLAYNDDCIPKYTELKHRLDVTRVEMLDLYRIIIHEPILNIQKNTNTLTGSEIRNCIDEYLNLLTNAISEKEFVIDYHRFYPIDLDIETACKACPEIDSIKCDYILSLLSTSIGDVKLPANAPLQNMVTDIAGPSGIPSSQEKERCNDVNCINNKVDCISNDPVKLTSLISEAKDILCDYGEGFIQLCLKHYNYNVESVIHAVLDGKLPQTLKKLDTTLPYIPPDSMEESSSAVNTTIDIQEPNVSHNEEFHMSYMQRDHVGKKKDKYKSADEMFNDKSDIRQSKAIYEKYSIVEDYDDEYDDTYDSHDIRGDYALEIDARPFNTSRFQVRRLNDKQEVNSEDDTEVEDEKPVQNNDHFVQNPEELRTKAEQRKRSARGGRSTYNAAGKPGNQEQDRDASSKGQNKAKTDRTRHGNHNRRKAFQVKRRQGIIPS